MTGLAIDTGDTAAIGINATNSNHFTIDSVSIVARGNNPVLANDAEYLTLAHSTITGRGSLLHRRIATDHDCRQ